MLAGAPVISEFMASNATTLVDGDGDTPDWIELHNTGSDPVDLAGWSLTDDPGNLEKWSFPSRTMDAGQYLIVFASGKDRQAEQGDLHTNFKLSAGGEYLALVAPGDMVVSEFGPHGTSFPPQEADVSYGVTPAGNRYFTDPTPGGPNGLGQTSLVSAPAMSVDHGLFETPFQVAVTSSTPGATIRYTTDGSVPTEGHGAVYSDPIVISGTTILRAAAFKQDFIPSAVETRTYLFPGDVLQQDGAGLDAADWGHAGPDWEVDPEIVRHPDPASRLVVDDLLAIPTVSLAMNFDDMFGPGGIYPAGQGVEKATSVELLRPDGSAGFQIDGSVQIVGGSSVNRWNSDKLSMRLKFNRRYGSGDLKYPVFGNQAASSFDTLVLDAHFHNTWHYGADSDTRNQRLRAQYLRDQVAADLQLAMGGYAPHSKHVHLYINGIYWGMYELHERPDDNFAASYLGGNNDDYDVIKHNQSQVVHGSNDRYQALLDAAGSDLSDADNYQAVLGLLDVDAFIDYVLLNVYGGNQDWPYSNWYATYNRVDPSGRWRYHSWDAEKIFHNLTDNKAGANTGPMYIHQQLTANPEYRLRFADHIHRRLFNDGVLTPTGVATIYQTRLDQIDRAVVAESARWGDNRRETPYTRGLEWVHERDRLLGSYFPRRTAVVLDQLKQRGLYPNVAAPELNRHGGTIQQDFELDLAAAAGTIYYTTDGTDPRLEGGAIAPGAVEYTGPFRLASPATVKARALDRGQWSALDEADFTVLADLPLRITELNVNPPPANPVPGLGEQEVDNDRFEFIELVNRGSAPLDLDGARLIETGSAGDHQGITFAFASQTLAAGARTVVVRDRAAFESRYGLDVPIAHGTGGAGGADGQYGGKLSNRGEQITLVAGAGAIIQQFTYGTADPWPSRSGGHGSTLEVIDTAGDYNDAGNWRASAEYGGSPGQAGTGRADDILVNEVLSRGTAGQPDHVELVNVSSQPLDLSGWYLTDTIDTLPRFTVPAGTTIPAGAYLDMNLAGSDLGLSGTEGDEVWLVAADEMGRPLRFVDHVPFDASDEGVALGRWPDADPVADLVPMIGPTLGAANSGPAIGAAIVSEIHYHPALEPIVEEDFADGATDRFTPVSGTWVVRDGGYEVTPGPEEETIATIATAAPLPTNFVYSLVVNARSVDGFNKNAVIVVDYHSPTDFKFVAMFAGGDKWKVGQRDASGWHFLATVETPIEPDTAVPVRIEIRGSRIGLWASDIWINYDFGTPLSDGQVGLGSRNGVSRFDDIHLEFLGDPQDLAFVELVGTTDVTTDLEGWRLADAVEWTFAAGATLAPGIPLVVVGFDPGDVERRTFFREALGIEGPVLLVGPYPAPLNNQGGVVRLLKPVGPAASTTGLVLVDRAAYDGQAPWPLGADGRGGSVNRAGVAAFGGFSSSWSALAPTPGTVRFAMTGDLNFDGVVDTDDIHGFVQVLANRLTYESAHGIPATMVADADGDGDVDVDDIDCFVALVEGDVSTRVISSGSMPNAPVRAHSAVKARPRRMPADAAVGARLERAARATEWLDDSRQERPHRPTHRPANKAVRTNAARARRPARIDQRLHGPSRDEPVDANISRRELTDRVMETERVWLGHAPGQ